MNWPEVPLSKLCRIETGRTPSRANPEYFGGGNIWVTISDLNDDIVCESKENVTDEAVSKTRMRPVSVGTILLSYKLSLGKLGIAGRQLYTNEAIAALPPRSGIDLIPKYLFYALKSVDYLSLCHGAVKGKCLNQASLSRILIPYPAKSEQQRIVEVLDQANALRMKRADADAKATHILPSLFYKMFGDPATNPKRWKPGTLHDVIVETQYGTSLKANTGNEGIPVIRMNNIDIDGYLDLTNLKHIVLTETEEVKYSLNAGDLLFNRTNSKELVGKTGLWSGEITAVPASYLIRVRIDKKKVTPEFIWAYMNCPFMKQILLNMSRRAIGMANINAQELRSFPLIIPDMDIQELFTTKLQLLEKQREFRNKSRLQIDALFQTMLHQTFVGNLTNKWREGRMEELIAEMKAQAKALDDPLAKDVVCTIGNRHAGHEMFGKAALAAYITQKCHHKQYPLGRVKLAKLFYLVQRKAELELTQEFAKRAAGPLDDAIFKFLNLAKKKKWVSFDRAKGDLKPVSPGPEVQEAVVETEKILGDALAPVNDIIEKMRTWGRDALERWATVLHAAEELIAAGTEPTLENIKNSLLSHPVWKDKLDREEFSDSNLASTLKGLRSFGFLTEINQKG